MKMETLKQQILTAKGGPWWGHGSVRSLALALAAAAREPVDVDRIISVKGYGCNGCC